jgi:mono/diheme cytochrome c family protein
MKRRYQLMIMAAFCGMLVYACGGSKDKKPETVELAVEISGEQVYMDNCMICHGKDGKAQMSGATDLSTSVLVHEAALNVVTNGRNGMRGFGSQLTKEEVDAVVKHIESLRK